MEFPKDEVKNKIVWTKGADFTDGSPRYTFEGRDPATTYERFQVVIYTERERRYAHDPGSLCNHYYGYVRDDKMECAETIGPYPETRRQMDSWLEESNSKNRNEFVEKALRFYMGYLGTENITEYLSDALVATLRGIIADSTNRTNGILFKCAVEQGIMAHTIAAHFRDTMEDRRALRGYVVDEVKRTNGQIRFEDAQDVQRQLPDDTWRG